MVITKTPAVVKTQALTVINSMLEQFQKWINQPTDPIAQDVERIVSKNFQLFSNNQLVTKTAIDYVTRLIKLRKRYSHVDLTGPLEEPLIADNKVALTYELNLSGRDGKRQIVFITAIATVEDNRIVKWVQATHEKGAGTWDR